MISRSTIPRRNARVRAPFEVQIAGRSFKVHDFSLRGVSIVAPGVTMTIGEIFAGVLSIPMKQGEARIAVWLTVASLRPDVGVIGFSFGDPSEQLLTTLMEYIESNR